jgi:tellurite resistance protein TerC
MGLAIVLTFIGVKMLVTAVGVHIPIWISLVFVGVVLLSSVAASLIWPKDCETGIEVDLPEDFDSPFEDDEPEVTAPEQPEAVASEEEEKEEPMGVERR